MIVIIILVNLLTLPGAFGWNVLQNILEKHFGSFYQGSVDLVHLTSSNSVVFNYYDVNKVYKNFPRIILPVENYTCPKAWNTKFRQGKFLVLADVNFFPETLQATRNNFIVSFASPLNMIYIFILPSSLIDSSQKTLGKLSNISRGALNSYFYIPGSKDFQLFYRKPGSGALVTVEEPLDYILKCLESSGISNLWEENQVDRVLAGGQKYALKWLNTKQYYNGESQDVDDSWMFSLLLMQILLLGTSVGFACFIIELIIAEKYKLICHKTRVETITDQDSNWVNAPLYLSWYSKVIRYLFDLQVRGLCWPSSL
ncbi:unnamed protein product [Allacma fusca]|uniref:Uncharacterized protein n=1 Tax=Allacma fusca TaxID=39272 RepID=A0A8J2K0H8_9HEXA|nr:unnamed protein product [Allacma fusca]